MRRRFLKSFSASVILSLSGLAAAQNGPDPSQVYIQGLSYGGTGCQQGEVGSYITDDALAFALIFDQYYVEAGPGIPRSKNRAFCNITIDLHVPSGWQYSVFKVDYRGYASLDRGTHGEQESVYRFLGASGRDARPWRTIIRGAYDDNYEINDTLTYESLVWSPCGVNRPLHIKTSAKVTANGRNRALMTVDTIDGEFRQLYAMKWQRCR